MPLGFDVFQTSKKPVVENHMRNGSISPTHHAEAFSSHIVTHISQNEVHSSTSPGEGELAGQGVDDDHLLYVSICWSSVKT